MRIGRVLTIAIGCLIIFLSACGGGSSSSSSSGGNGGGGGGSATVPQFQHVAIVLLENASYSDVIGSSSMPYLNSLAAKYAVAQNYYANGHPSIPNYFMLTTGQTITTDDSYTATVSVDNLAREFIASGVSWKAYEESIPSAGYTGGDTGLYLEHHDPFSYFSDVRNSTSEAANLVPFPQLASDMSSGTLPSFIWITPNVLDDAHSCPSSNPSCTLQSRLATADTWLQTNIAPLLADANFSASGLLIIVFDESEDSNTTNGGGHVAFVLAGTNVKPAYTSTTFYQHQDTLGLIGTALRLGTIPGAGANATSMAEFFQ